MPADEDGLEDGRREEIDAVLRQPSAFARALAGRKRGERSGIVRNRSGHRCAQSCERCDERRLAGAIGSDDDPALSRAHVEVDIRAQRAARDPDCEATTRETRCGIAHARAPLRVRR